MENVVEGRPMTVLFAPTKPGAGLGGARPHLQHSRDLVSQFLQGERHEVLVDAVVVLLQAAVDQSRDPLCANLPKR